MVLDVVAVRLLVVMSAEASQALVAQEGFHRVDAPNENVQPAVELLLVENERVIDVTLDEVFVVEGRLGQVTELLQQQDTVAAAALARLGDESLPGELAQMVLEVPHLIRQQEAVGHELVVDGEEALETADDDAENVLLCEVVHQRVTVKYALAHLDNV